MAIHLIWQTAPGEQSDFEFEYTTRVLFGQMEQVHHHDHGAYQTVVDNAVIIYSSNSPEVTPELIHYINRFVKRGLRFYLLHFSNEDLKHDCWYYAKANYVFRNYFDPQITLPNVLFLPLGFKSGFLNLSTQLNDCTERDIGATFIGHPKSDRFEMITAMQKTDTHYLHKTNAWNDAAALTTAECIDIYKKTRYTPCPMGNIHPDSFRICETLEWGCIPVLRRINGLDYFKNIYGNHPMRLVNDWSEIIELDQSDFCTEQVRVHTWYLNFKNDLQLKIKNIIDNGGVASKPRVSPLKDLKFELRRLYRIMMGRK